MSLSGSPQRSDGPLTTGSRPLFERERSAAVQSITERARLALGAVVANTSTVDADGTVRVVGWCAEPGARYERALSAGRRIVPGIDPARVTFRSTVNPAVAAVLVEGRTMVTPFEDVARNVVHPWIIRFTSMILELHWTISVPPRSGDRVIGSFAAHLTRPVTDAQRSQAEQFAHDAAAALQRAGAV